MMPARAEPARQVDSLLERLEAVDLELLSALAAPEVENLDELLRRRQECTSALDEIDAGLLQALPERDKKHLLSKIKAIQLSGERLLALAASRARKLAAARRQNAVGRRAANGYRPPKLRLVVDRRLQA